MNEYSAIARRIKRIHGRVSYAFHCPGCKCGHMVITERGSRPGPQWTFNGDQMKPTFKPSIKVTGGNAAGVTICHSYVTDGMIEFLSDCTHELVGQTVKLEPL